jgi:hypothetical protein
VNGDFTTAFAETIASATVEESPSDPDELMDYRAVDYFIHN